MKYKDLVSLLVASGISHSGSLGNLLLGLAHAPHSSSRAVGGKCKSIIEMCVITHEGRGIVACTSFIKSIHPCTKESS